MSMTSKEIPKPINLSIGNQLAEFLDDSRDRIISEWAAAVHGDRKINSSEALTHGQLTDHVPQLLDDLNHTLCNASSEDVKQQSAWTAATHGQMRWKEGYDISELLRELAILRLALITRLIEFQEHYADVGAARNLFAMVTVHGLIDNAMRTSVEQFIATGERVTNPG